MGIFSEKENPDERLLRLIKRKADRREYLINNLIAWEQSGAGSGGVSKGIDLKDTSTTVIDANEINIPAGSLVDNHDGSVDIHLVISAHSGESGNYSGHIIFTGSNGVVISQVDGEFTFGVPFIDGIGDVVLTSTQNGDLLVYDSGSSKWINKTPEKISTETACPVGQWTKIDLGAISATAFEYRVSVIYRIGSTDRIFEALNVPLELARNNVVFYYEKSGGHLYVYVYNDSKKAIGAKVIYFKI